MNSLRKPIVDLEIPFNNLYGVNSSYLSSAFEAVLGKGVFILGDWVRSFEEEWAKFCNKKFCVGVASGTDALTLSMLAVDDGCNGVITVANSVPATIISILQAGKTPVLCDVDRKTGLMTAEQLKILFEHMQNNAPISLPIKFVVPVHLYGNMCDIVGIQKVCGSCSVIEDASHAHGSRLNGKVAGSLGYVGAFSFYPTKPLGALGDAGAVVTDDEVLANHVRLLRNYGAKDSDSLPTRLGKNSRLDELQAAFLFSKMSSFGMLINQRSSLIDLYTKLLEGVAEVQVVPRIGECNASHMFAILVEDRRELRDFLLEKGIESKVRYRMWLPEANFGHVIWYDLSNTKYFCDHVLCLPLWNGMEDDMVKAVCTEIKNFYTSRTK